MPNIVTLFCARLTDLTAALVASLGCLPLVTLGGLLAYNSLPAFFIDVHCCRGAGGRI